MQIHKAEFVTSAGRPQEYPPGDLPEIAFSGRSNVGKSSLMNNLLGRKNLVKTAKAPGKTRRLNFFDAEERLRLVDLPGYGYAQVAPSERESWKPMVEAYLEGRPQLRLCILLVDIRREPMDSDLEMLEYLQSTGLPHQVVATKADKLKKTQLQAAVAKLRRAFGEDLIVYSSETGLGRDELWRRILEECPEARPPRAPEARPEPAKEARPAREARSPYIAEARPPRSREARPPRSKGRR